ncbi:MAG TPA: kelch repeat-containing protein [Polyangiaceae bacterium]|jgi:N-acetylneuraminic acid mutarotase|nr:kelch repeat-containing protein [Polyangiaceae bacterium]
MRVLGFQKVVFGVLGAAFALVTACSDSIHLTPEPNPNSAGSTGAAGGGGSGGGAPTACSSSSDCPAPTAVCDTVKSMCVECLDVEDCSFRPGTVCSTGQCVCPTGGESFCGSFGGASSRCVDLTTSSADCGSCNHACFGACNAGKCADPWEPTGLVDAPAPRRRHVALWTGSQMIVWGGEASDGTSLRTGGIYDPASMVWRSTSVANAPSGRHFTTAVWTGSKMVVWGGSDGSPLNSGGVFDPATNTWVPTSKDNAPSARYNHSAVWTGSKMLVWGGFDGASHLASGGVYDLATDTWTQINESNVPYPRRRHTAIWTGEQMVIFGGFGFDGVTDNVYLSTGGQYDPPPTDSWSLLQLTDQPSPRADHTAVWTGTEMLIWGGDAGGGLYLSDGRKYHAVQAAWVAMNGGAPEGRALHTAVWVNERMIVWGGFNGAPLSSGGIYDPVSNAWASKPMPTALTGRYEHTAVAAGNKMIVWGGYTASGVTNTGGTFDPAFTP